ncbi:MAG TPA: cystathionine beta-lyase [Alphaproteobacteria bacterium]|nr:cystathionine beta-lyase [Alphaproteobacteria bacterium]
MTKTDRGKSRRPATVAAHAGFDPASHHGTVNPPVYRTSTVLFPTVEALERGETKPFEGMRYGRIGTPTSKAFEDALAALEGGHSAVVANSGLAACTTALLSCVKAGDHALITDSVYGPTRAFASRMLTALGVEVEYYPPTIGAGIKSLFRPNTRAVYLESPGSWSFEVQDVPAIAEAAKAQGSSVLMDNTWATPVLFQPLAHGVDLSIQAVTKYISGHSDAMLGAITVRDAVGFQRLKTTQIMMGQSAGTEELYLGLRGLRTLPVRLERHGRTGLALAEWLAGRDEVIKVLHPALPSDPGHHLWKRDFAGCSGLFGVLIKPYDRAAVTAMVEGMSLFKMGWSWGGFESLIVPGFHLPLRTTGTWPEGVLLRIHAGLEDLDDLKDDLEDGFRRLAKVAG